jgi:acyl-CoA dehydrogenase
MMDTSATRWPAEIAMIKVVAPNMACQVIDWAIQAHGECIATPSPSWN